MRHHNRRALQSGLRWYRDAALWLLAHAEKNQNAGLRGVRLSEECVERFPSTTEHAGANASAQARGLARDDFDGPSER